MPTETAEEVLQNWIQDGLQNIRFSGGEPTLYPQLDDLVYMCYRARVKRVALSTNGSADFSRYKELYVRGVNDFSISLDACCAGKCKTMTGVDMFEKITDNIKKLSALTYVTIGLVVTKDNIDTVKDTVVFASNLGVADIRIIPAAQNNELKLSLEDIPQNIIDKHPILRYRVNRALNNMPVRGITFCDSHRCSLVQDDSVVAGSHHYPCVIYLREGGKPIGKISRNMRKERLEWASRTDIQNDPICKSNCLDVCVAYNNFLK
jgi:molybdenum cofactor biosynthesis enzyme MoaA